jgi:hypothetical protein
MSDKSELGVLRGRATFSRTRVVIIAFVVIGFVFAAGLWAYASYGNRSAGPLHYPELRTLFDANQTPGYANSTGSFTNVTVSVVNGSVALSSLILYVVPKDGAIMPTLSWVVYVYLNSSSHIPVCNYDLTTNVSFSTTNSSNLSAGMVFSAFTPGGISLSGGYLGFQSAASLSLETICIS